MSPVLSFQLPSCSAAGDHSRPEPTRADNATTRPSNGARSTAIYNGTASPAPTPDQSRPVPTKQPPDPLTEPDLPRLTMGQRRRRPHPTRADQATTRPSNGARSTAIYNGTASPAPTPDQSRPAPTKQPPDPLTEPDLPRFTMGQRRRRPHPTRADQRRPSNHQTIERSQIYCDLQWDSVAGAHTQPEPTSADQATTRPSNGARSTAIYNGTVLPAPTPDQRRPSNRQTL